jgi:hypothetical protein
MRWFGTEMRNHPTYDGTSDVEKFVTDIEGNVAPDQ